MLRISVYSLCFMLAVMLTGYYAQGQADQNAKPGTTQTMPEKKKQWMEKKQQWMEKHKQMMEQMQKNDQELQKKVDEMNKASGDQKVNAMAGVIDQLVKDRLHMHKRMMQMHEQGGCPGMGGHEHMHGGKMKMKMQNQTTTGTAGQ